MAGIRCRNESYPVTANASLCSKCGQAHYLYCPLGNAAHAMVFKCRNGMVFEEKLLSEELYYYSRIEDKISVYMEKVKVNFTTVNLKEVH